MQLELPYHLENYIDGYFIGPLSGQFLPNINPATGEVYGQLPASNDRDVELAYRAAQKAFVGWSNTPATERFAVLNRIADLIDEHLAVLALAETNDSGKPLWLSKAVDIPRASANIRFFATGILHFASESHAMEGMGINYTLRQPIGVVGCISPWNLPLYLFTWKIAPALAAGNCVVAKPSEVTPATAFLLGKLCQAAGLPGGVLNIVHGTGPDCGEAIVRHPGIKAISFTGSTRAGERIAGIAAPLFKKLSLELGGKNPALIFADCNWERMLQETVRAAFSNQGQICLCTSNLLIERRIYDRFREAFVERAKQLTVGDPLENGVRQGALVGEAHFNKVMACIETARQEGGTLLCGGLPVTLEGRCAKGWFVQPTVLEGLDGNSQTCQQEIFGPVVTLRPFDTMEEALAMANANQYGLAATVWTQDLNKAHQAAQQLQCGIVWVNCWLLRDLRTPFGGVKNSGVGREGGWEALRFFTEPKNVCVRY